MNDIRKLEAFCGVLRRKDAPDELVDTFADFFASYQLSERDLEAIKSIGIKPLLMYRTMVHTRLKTIINDWIPRTVARLGPQGFHQEFIAFMAAEAPKTPYLRQVPSEFVAWAMPRWQTKPEIPVYLADLARHELLYGDVYNMSKGGEAETGHPLALDRPLRIDGTASMIRYDYAVHRLPANLDDRSEPCTELVHLLVYRDRENHRVHYLELGQRAAAVMQRLLEGQCLEAALKDACQALGQALDDDFLASMVHFLADLEQRKVLLGAERSPDR